MKTPTPTETNSLPLAATGIDLALLRFRLRARRRAAWLRFLASENRSLELDAILDDHDTPAAEAAWIEGQPWAARSQEALRDVEAAIGQDQTSSLARIRAIFGLSPEDADLLEACAASAGPAISAVAIRAAVKFLNMVVSSFVSRRRMRVAPIVEERFTPYALNAP